MTVQCCRCKKVKHEADWVAIASPLSGAVSHGFCPVCYEKTRAEYSAEAQAVARARREQARRAHWGAERPAVGYGC